MNCFKLPFSLNLKPLNKIKEDCLDCFDFYMSILGLQEDGDYEYEYYNKNTVVTTQPQTNELDSHVINVEPTQIKSIQTDESILLEQFNKNKRDMSTQTIVNRFVETKKTGLDSLDEKLKIVLNDYDILDDM